MFDHPILFSAPMVRAIIDGRKTMTRRVCIEDVPQPPSDTIHAAHVGGALRDAPYLDAYCSEPKSPTNPRGAGLHWCWWTRDNRPGRQFKPARWIPGDRLWVRETWRTLQKWDDIAPRHCMDDLDKIDYAASGFARNPLWAWGRTRSPIYMPRWASRITLGVEAVRVERLQDITEADAIAEGMVWEQPTPEDCEWHRQYCAETGTDPAHNPMEGVWIAPGTRRGYGLNKRDRDQPQWHVTARDAFSLTWRTIHGPEAWDANPWVSVTAFRLVADKEQAR